MSELFHEAQEIRNFWKALKPEYALDQGPYIHPEDLAKMKDLGADKTFSQWCMSNNPGDKGSTFSVPSVPQPFIGNLEDPKILIVTFNPGFQPFSDWALGNTNSILNTTICKKMPRGPIHHIET